MDDDGETVLLEFGTLPARVTAGTTASATVTLTDDDERGVMVSETELTIPEGNSDSYTVVLSSEPTAPVTVTVSGTDGTDLTAPAEGLALTFTALDWGMAQTVTVTAAADADAVVPPAVELAHTVAGGDYAGEPAASLTVRTTELTVPELTLSPSAPTVAESIGGAGQTFTVTLSVASSNTVTVAYATADGTAAAVKDYTTAAATLTFAPGEPLTQTFSVPILGDALDEDDETFTVALGSPMHATVGAPATVTITDDDPLPQVNLPSGFVIAAEADGELAVTVSLSPVSGREVKVNYGSADLSGADAATAGTDYGAVAGTLAFPAGTTTRKFTVSITQDALDEGLFEEFSLILSDPVNAVLGTTARKTTRINDDDDEPTLDLLPAPSVSVDEGRAVTFTAQLSAPSALAVNLTYETSNGTAMAPGDYTATNGRVNLQIPPGETSATFLVSTTNDALDEEDAETFAVRIRRDDFNATLGAYQTTVTINDNDEPPALRVADAQAREDAGALVFRVTMPASEKTVTVDHAVTAGTATVGVDYTAVAAGTLTFTAGTTEQTLSVPVLDDEVHERDETLTAALSDPTNATLADGQATGTITDDEPTPVVSLGLDPDSIDEDGGGSTVTAALSGASSETVTATVTATAVAPAVASDFTQSGTTLTITAGATASTGTVTVTAVANDVDAPDKTVTVSGSVSGGIDVADPLPQGLTIVDDEPTPVVTLVLSPATIGEDGGKSTVTATLSGLSSAAVRVEVSAEPGTGASAGDFTQSGTTLDIAAGTTASTGTVTVTAEDNVLDTLDKMVAVTGTVTGGSAENPQQELLTIEDDEELEVAVSANAMTVVEGNDATFTVAVDGGTSTAPVPVTYTVAGTATAGTDYTAPSGTLTLEAAAASGTITIATRTDTVLDPGETLVVTLSGASTSTGAVTAVPTAAQTTIGDEGMVTVSVTAGGAVAEGSPAEFEVALSGAVASAVEVGWSTMDGTATAGADYTAVASQTLTFESLSTAAQTITVATRGDALAEDDETFTVTLTGAGLPAGVSVGTAAATATITDDDALTVAVTADAETVVEGNAATFTVTVAGGTSTAPVPVTYTVAGTATAPTDYTAPSGTLTLEAAAASGTITIATHDEMVLDRGETLVVTLSGASTSAGEVTADATPAQMTISDEGAVTVSVTAGDAVAEGSPAEFEVALSGAVASAVEVGWSTTDGTATAGADYTAVAAQTLTFAALSTAAQTITVATRGDALAEDDETFTVTVTLSDPVPGVSVGTATATATITDDDALTVAVTADAMTVVEGNAATFTVAVAGGTSTAPVAVTYAVAGTATAGTDYTAPSGSLTLEAADSSGTITIAARTDSVLDGGETLIVTLTGASTSAGEVTADATTAQTTISDEGTVTVSVTAGGAVAEGSPAEFEVALSGAVASAVEVDWSTTDGTATAGADYTAVASQRLTFESLSTAAQTITVATRGDALAENDETFTGDGDVVGSGARGVGGDGDGDGDDYRRRPADGGGDGGCDDGGGRQRRDVHGGGGGRHEHGAGGGELHGGRHGDGRHGLHGPVGLADAGSRGFERDDHDRGADRLGSGRRRDADSDADGCQHVCGGGDGGRDDRADHDFGYRHGDGVGDGGRRGGGGLAGGVHGGAVRRGRERGGGGLVDDGRHGDGGG